MGEWIRMLALFSVAAAAVYVAYRCFIDLKWIHKGPTKETWHTLGWILLLRAVLLGLLYFGTRYRHNDAVFLAFDTFWQRFTVIDTATPAMMLLVVDHAATVTALMRLYLRLRRAQGHDHALRAVMTLTVFPALVPTLLPNATGLAFLLTVLFHEAHSEGRRVAATVCLTALIAVQPMAVVLLVLCPGTKRRMLWTVLPPLGMFAAAWIMDSPFLPALTAQPMAMVPALLNLCLTALLMGYVWRLPYAYGRSLWVALLMQCVSLPLCIVPPALGDVLGLQLSRREQAAFALAAMLCTVLVLAVATLGYGSTLMGGWSQ